MKRYLFALLLLLAAAAQAAAQTTVIRAGRLLDPETGTAAPNQTIIVEGGRIDVIHDLPNYTRGTRALTRIDSYVAAGMAPRDVLKAMTTTAARLLGVEATRGALRPGMAADIIATAANPLEDINALKQVSFVMKDGAVFRHLSK